MADSTVSSTTANGTTNHDSLQGKQDPPANKQYQAFAKHQNSMQLGLSATILTISQRCRAKKLIPRLLYNDLFGGKWSQEQQRSQYFLNCFCRRLYAQENVEVVKAELKTLAEIVAGEGALDDTAKKIGTV